MRTGRTRPTRSLTVASPTLILDMAARRQAPSSSTSPPACSARGAVPHHLVKEGS